MSRFWKNYIVFLISLFILTKNFPILHFLHWFASKCLFLGSIPLYFQKINITHTHTTFPFLFGTQEKNPYRKIGRSLRVELSSWKYWKISSSRITSDQRCASVLPNYFSVSTTIIVHWVIMINYHSVMDLLWFSCKRL